MPERSHRSATTALGIDPLEAQIRQVFFFDTPDLALNQAGVVVRARRVQGRDHDAVVKLRPVVPDELPAELRADPGFVVEVDALPGRLRLLGIVQGHAAARTPSSRRCAASGRCASCSPRRSGRSTPTHAPDGHRARRPVGARADLRAQAEGHAAETLGRRLVAEMWLYPDGSRIVELSTKCLPGAGHGRRRRGARLPRRPRASTSTASSRPRPRRRSSSSPASCGRAGLTLYSARRRPA